MKFCRFMHKEGTRYGLVESVDGSDNITHSLSGPQLQMSAAGAPEQIVLPTDKAEKLDKPILLDAAKLLLPLPIVSKILCVGGTMRSMRRSWGTRCPLRR